MDAEAALREMNRLLQIKGGLTSEAGIASTHGRRRALEQSYGEAVRAARRNGINLGYPSKAKRRYSG